MCLNDDIEIELLDVAESSNGGADLRRGSNGAGEDQDDENGPLSNWKINAQESLLPKIRSKEEIREIKQRNEDVANFYKNQNLLIFDFLRLDKDEKEGDEEEDDSDLFSTLSSISYPGLLFSSLPFFRKEMSRTCILLGRGGLSHWVLSSLRRRCLSQLSILWWRQYKPWLMVEMMI